MTIRFHINAGNLWSLGSQSAVPRVADDIDYHGVRRAGFVGFQHYFPDQRAVDAGLEMSGIAKVLNARSARDTARQHKAWGFVASTWQVGTGFEDDDEMNVLADAVLDAEVDAGLPISVETHRATMTQDPQRTLALLARFPDLKINADLSHWYTGAEMPNGDFAAKLELLKPVFERVRFMHGRIGHSSMAQLPLDHARRHPCWGHFEAMWTRCLEGFQRTAAAGESLIFAPELLPATVEYGGETHYLNYAMEVGGEELSDRWLEALEMKEQVEELARKAGLPSPG